MSKSANRVALDASVLIAAFSAAKPGADPAGRQNAENLIAELGKRRAHIVIPAICVSEALAEMAAGDRAKFLQWLQARAEVPSFDGAVALRTAKFIGAKTWKTHVTPGVYARQCVKGDVQIIATCEESGVDVLYSQDPHFRILAKALTTMAIGIESVPMAPQMTLPNVP